jgi:hypothetical protein
MTEVGQATEVIRDTKGAAWRRFIENLPTVDEDFARDVKEARRELGYPTPARPS